MAQPDAAGFRTEPCLGDTFVTTAFAAAIRRKFPKARIIARVDNQVQREVYCRNPSIDELSETVERADVAAWFDFYQVPTVWYDEKRFPEQERVAAARRRGVEQMMLGEPVTTQEGRAGGLWMTSCLMDLLGLGRFRITCALTDLDATIRDAAIYIPLEDRDWAQRLGDGSKIATLYNGTGRMTKCWPIERWSEVARRLAARGFTAYQLGVASDLAVPGADSILGRTTLRQAAAVVRRASLHLGIDGSMTHFAAASGVPAVVLFGPTPAGLYGYDHHTNLASTCCKNCWDRTDDWQARCPRDADAECMKSIGVEQVWEAVVLALACGAQESSGAPER